MAVGSADAGYPVLALLPGDRVKLHRRIERRFDAMLESGLVEELRSLREKLPLAPDMPAMRCVGYRQAWKFLQGEINQAELRLKGIAATRQLAKRQLTWLRAMPRLTVFDCLESSLENSVAGYVQTCVAAASQCQNPHSKEQ